MTALGHIFGFSWCRMGCESFTDMGTQDKTDGTWLYPEGFVHYLRHHHVKPPDEFLDHVRALGYMVPDVPVFGVGRLDAFVGTWNTEMEMRDTSFHPGDKGHATGTYEWLPGEKFLIHRWDEHTPYGRAQGIGIIGYDAHTDTHPMYAFYSGGNTEVMRGSFNQGVWMFEGDSVRFTGRFHDNGKTFAGLWEWRSEDRWLSWAEVTMRKAT